MPKTKPTDENIDQILPDSAPIVGGDGGPDQESIDQTEETSELSALKDQLASTEISWKRALADYQNLLRRVETDKKEFTKMASANLIARLLPSLDIIDMAAAHTKDLGVEMAAKQFHSALDEEGLITIEPKVGDKFDATHHECTEVIDAGDNQPETIAELVLKGYKLGDFVLRPARVKVFKLALDK